MEKRFIIPAVSFIAAVIVWVALAFLPGIMGWESAQTSWLQTLLCLITGILMFISAARCRQVAGPRGGIIFRAILLLLMAVYTFWKIGIAAAFLLLVAAIACGVLALGKFKQSEEVGDSSSTSSRESKKTD